MHLSEQQYKLKTAKEQQLRLQVRNMHLRNQLEEQQEKLTGIKLEYKEEHDKTLQAVRDYHELTQKSIPQAKEVLKNLQTSVLSLKKEKDVLFIEKSQKLAEIENLTENKADLEKGNTLIKRNNDELMQRFYKNKSILEQLAADIVNIPDFIAEYGHKLSQQAKKILQATANNQDATSSTAGFTAPKQLKQKATVESSQPSFTEFVKQQGDARFSQAFRDPEIRQEKTKGRSR